jgi:acid phosphatase
LASQGILLTNFYAVTHPSEPNYCAVAGGDYFGITDDSMHAVPAQVASVVDILEEKGISWAEYQEDMPYSGFQGFNYTVPANDYVEYVRKHNPLVYSRYDMLM